MTNGKEKKKERNTKKIKVKRVRPIGKIMVLDTDLLCNKIKCH
jgi:hypothetical protein